GGRQRGTPNKGARLPPTPSTEAAEVRALARKYTAAAIGVLAEMMHHARESSTRVAAAKALLDRGWGLPKVDISIESALYVIRDKPLSPEEWQAQYCVPDDAPHKPELLPDFSNFSARRRTN